MKTEELKSLENVVKSQILYKMQDYMQDEIIDLDSMDCLGKLYTRI